MQQDPDSIREQAEKIERSGALGRSRSYARLLRFLVDSSLAGRTPKEVEIAIEVFGKGADFDPSQDSMVRVYAHNLRQKLEHYYATEGRAAPQQLALARGEYRVYVVPVEAADEPRRGADALPVPNAEPVAPPVAVLPAAAAHSAGAVSAARPSVHPRARLAAALAAVLVVGLALGILIGRGRTPPPTAEETVAASPVWASLFDDDLPILVVVGDYYIFAELDAHGDVERLVRDFDVNSREELDNLVMYDDKLRGRYLDLDLTYLPSGSASALLDVLRVLYTADKPVRVMSMSQMSAADMKTSHIVYLGYISALGKLEEFAFASSRLTVGYTYDELRNTETGDLYASEAGMPEANRNYRDYAFLSTFPGAAGNQFVIAAGTRDAGMMQAAHALSDPMLVRSVEESRPDETVRPPAFEMLYEVSGYGRTNLDARLVHAAKLDYQVIWGGPYLRAAD